MNVEALQQLAQILTAEVEWDADDLCDAIRELQDACTPAVVEALCEALKALPVVMEELRLWGHGDVAADAFSRGTAAIERAESVGLIGENE